MLGILVLAGAVSGASVGVAPLSLAIGGMLVQAQLVLPFLLAGASLVFFSAVFGALRALSQPVMKTA